MENKEKCLAEPEVQLATAPPNKRGTWSSCTEVFLTYVGYCIGLGNIWRFPYLCYKSGGGAFLVPYFLMLTLVGLPLYYVELAIGQFSAMGPSKCWSYCPILKGVGYCSIVASAISCIYYNQLLAYSLLFLFHSMRKELPWASCQNEWNTPDCFVPNRYSNTSFEDVFVNSTLPTPTLTSTIATPGNNYTSAAEEFWELKILKRSKGIEEVGIMDWQLVLALASAWILVFLCLVKGIQSTGKVVYVTAILPLLVLAVLLVRGVTLPGSSKGLWFYLVPDFQKLKNPKVWATAASQVFYSSGAAWGILINCASYNKFNHKFNREAVIVPFICGGASIFAGLVIFSTVGFMAHIMNQDVSTVVKAGPGLVFVAYPEALAQMPVAPLWAVLFFVMVLTVAIDSMFATFEVVVGMLLDEFPSWLPWRPLVTAVLCFLWFLLGLPQATQAGMYVLSLLDWYVGTFPPLLVGLLEVISISYIYGYKNFQEDITAMLGSKPGIYWHITLYVSPFVIIGILIFNAVIFEPVSYGAYYYPKWAEGVGIVITLAPMCCIPLCALFLYYRSYRQIREHGQGFIGKSAEAFKALIRADKTWTDRRTTCDKEEKCVLLEKMPKSEPNLQHKCRPDDLITDKSDLVV